MTYEDYISVRDFISEKSLKLMKRENKEFAKAGFPMQNYTYFPFQGRYYYIAKTNPFKIIINNVLVEAQEKFPEKFGTSNAKDVLEAIYKIDPVFFEFEDFIEFLRNEQFCYVVEKCNEKITDKILRIDLFRHLKPNNGSGFDFVGGLFHAMKHFSYKGVPLSTGKEINDIPYIEHLIYSITKAFYSDNIKHKKGLNYSSLIDLNEAHNLRVEFYFEEKTNVYFINTAFKENNNNKGA